MTSGNSAELPAVGSDGCVRRPRRPRDRLHDPVDGHRRVGHRRASRVNHCPEAGTRPPATRAHSDIGGGAEASRGSSNTSGTCTSKQQLVNTRGTPTKGTLRTRAGGRRADRRRVTPIWRGHLRVMPGWTSLPCLGPSTQPRRKRKPLRSRSRFARASRAQKHQFQAHQRSHILKS
jgi:hypothetical protein